MRKNSKLDKNLNEVGESKSENLNIARGFFAARYNKQNKCPAGNDEEIKKMEIAKQIERERKNFERFEMHEVWKSY